MTTPAINVNVVSTTTVRHVGRSNYSGGYDFSIPYSVASFWHTQTRPASSTKPKNPLTGWRDCGAWNHYGHKVSKTGGTYGYRRTWPSGEYDVQEWTGGGLWNYSPYVNPLFPSNLENRCLVQALNKIKDQDIHLGNYFVEGKQTIGMIASRVRQIARTVRNFKRDYPKLWEKVKNTQLGQLPCHLWHTIPGLWLEVQYGWTPLLKDIFGAIYHLSKTGKTVGQVVGVGSSRTEYDLVKRTIDARQWAVTATTEVKLKHFAKVVLWFELNNPEQAELSSLGLINPTEWAWEAVKYSFVLDWLVPVGGWISSLTAGVGWTFKGGSASLLSTWEERGLGCTHLSGQSGAHRFETYGDGPVIKSDKNWKFLRKCYSDLPVPGLYYKNPLSPAHVANAIALLAVAFGSGRR